MTTRDTEITTPEKLNALIEDRLEAIGLPDQPAGAYSPFRYVLNLGGKRIRPFSVLIGCGICNGEIKEALSAAIAVELLHNFTLVHDDIMDKAETRRGHPSVHSKWDESTAILTGDLMFSKAAQQLLYYGTSERYTPAEFNHIQETFYRAVDTVCEGQALDLEFAKQEDISLREYLDMIEKKTGFLIGTSLKLGSVVARAPEKRQQKLFQIGLRAGIAFQIQDDLLDAVGNPSKFGKQLGGDIKEGKKTYLSILAAERADGEGKQLIYRVLRDKDVSRAEIETVIDLYENYGVIESAEEAIEKHYNKAWRLLDDFEEGPYKNALIQFIERLSEREQ